MAAVVLMGGAAGRARAHAPPQGTGLWWLPSSDSTTSGAAGERLVIRTPRGFLFQPAGANDLRFLCNEAVGIQDGEDASFADAEGSALLMTTFGRGLLRGGMDACRWSQVTTAVITPAFDVAVAGSGEFVVGGVPNQGEHLWVGREAGTTWSSLANSDMPFTRIRVAPSNSSRIYLTGIALGATGMAVHRLGVSEDAGATVADHLVALGPTDLQARVLGVDPLRPDHLYLRAESNSIELPERLLVSDDGGRSFSTAATLHELQGFSQSDDGREVWVGGSEGLYRSTDSGRTFVAPASPALSKITCLAFHKDRLYGCGVLDNLLVVAVSDDGGDTFRKLISFDQVTQAVDCPQDDAAGSPATVCAPALAHWRSELGTFNPPAPPPTMTGTGSAPSSGCSVGAGDQRPVGAAHLIRLLITFALWRPRQMRMFTRRTSERVSVREAPSGT